jgi:hypothetical protein
VLAIGAVLLTRYLYGRARKRDELSQLRDSTVGPGQQAALPVNPEDPPRFLTFRPKNGYVRNCDCHGNQLADGDTVLFWPTGDTVVVFCEAGVRENVAAE